MKTETEIAERNLERQDYSWKNFLKTQSVKGDHYGKGRHLGTNCNGVRVCMSETGLKNEFLKWQDKIHWEKKERCRQHALDCQRFIRYFREAGMKEEVIYDLEDAVEVYRRAKIL